MTSEPHHILSRPETQAFGFRDIHRMKVRGLGFRVGGFRVWGSGFGVQGLGFRVWGLGVGVQGLGFRVWGVWGSGFGV